MEQPIDLITQRSNITEEKARSSEAAEIINRKRIEELHRLSNVRSRVTEGAENRSFLENGILFVSETESAMQVCVYTDREGKHLIDEKPWEKKEEKQNLSFWFKYNKEEKKPELSLNGNINFADFESFKVNLLAKCQQLGATVVEGEEFERPMLHILYNGISINLHVWEGMKSASFSSYSLSENMVSGALNLASIILPEIPIEGFADFLSQGARKMLRTQKYERVFKKIETAVELINRPKIKKALEEDTRKAISAIKSLDEEDRQIAIEIMNSSTRSLVMTLAERFELDGDEIEKIYLQKVDKYEFSRALPFKGKELEKYWKGNPIFTLGGTIIETGGDEMYSPGIIDKRIFCHFSDAVALTCSFYSDDIGNPSGRRDSLANPMSFIEAKIFQAYLETQIIRGRIIRGGVAEGYMEGRRIDNTGRGFVVDLSEITEIVVPAGTEEEAIAKKYFNPSQVRLYSDII